MSERDLWLVAAEPPELDSINPTGSLFVDYDPHSRTGPLGPNVTTLDKAFGVHPDKPIQIYRGHNGEQKEIVPGDFVAAGPMGHDIATSYAAHKDNLQPGQSPADLGSRYKSIPQVLTKTVGHGDVVADPDDPEGGEYIYRPRQYKQAANYDEEGNWESGDWHGPDFSEHKYEKVIRNNPDRKPHQWQVKDHVPSDYDWLKDHEVNHDHLNRIVENPPSGKWYHTTPYELKPGDRLTPGGGQSPDSEYYTEWDGRKNRPNHVWLSGDEDQAKQWKYWAGGDAASIYEVHPGDTPRAWQNDPGQGYVVPHAVVKRRVS